jgi:hypothetical protein
MAENRLNYGKEISYMGYIADDGLRHGLHCGGAIDKSGCFIAQDDYRRGGIGF